MIIDLTSDPDLPSYLPKKYQEMAEFLKYVGDAWEGDTAWKKIDLPSFDTPGRFEVRRVPMNATGTSPKGNAVVYLPQEEAESDLSYRRRLTRALYKNFFRKIISGFSGMFLGFEWRGKQPASFDNWVSDVDLRGSTFKSFFREATQAALRDGWVGVFVDYTRMPVDEDGEPLIKSKADEKKFVRRPYLRLIERPNIINWEAKLINGKYNFEFVIIQETTLERDPETKYGDREVTRYRELRPGYMVLYEIVESGEGYYETKIVDNANTTLDTVPLVLFTATDINPLEARPPMYHLAQLTFSYYDLYSSYREVMHRCNLPVPVRKGMVEPGMSQRDIAELPPVILGSSSIVDVPADGDFLFAEPSGAAIAATREELLDLARDIVSEGLNFTSRETNNKTATETELDATQIKAIVHGMAELLESSVEQIVMFWSLWEGGGEEAGTIDISREALEPKIEAQAANVVLSMVTSGLLSRETALFELRARGFFSAAFDLERELSLTPEIELGMEQDIAMETAKAKQNGVNTGTAKSAGKDNGQRPKKRTDVSGS